MKTSFEINASVRQPASRYALRRLPVAAHQQIYEKESTHVNLSTAGLVPFGFLPLVKFQSAHTDVRNRSFSYTKEVELHEIAGLTEEDGDTGMADSTSTK